MTTMHTIEHRYPDGTRATYTVAPGSTLPLQIMALKPIKRPPRPGSDKRQFPRHEAHWSTADYVRRYFALNSHQLKSPAYPNHVHLALYHPLPDAPAATYIGVDSVEVLP
jgi:hypothetical protein